jgi:long-subunit acyl-CoA synthetase (AMP-forming)
MFAVCIYVFKSSVGRLDDVIVLASGEKVAPKPIEDALVSNMQVSAAIVFGRERMQAGVIVEPNQGRIVDTDQQKNEFLDEIWQVSCYKPLPTSVHINDKT